MFIPKMANLCFDNTKMNPTALLLWASVVAQMVKNPPAMWDTWVRLLDWEDPLEDSMESPWIEELAGSSSQGSRLNHN